MHPLAYLSLGSNLGDSRQILQAAISRLQFRAVAPLRISSFWQTAPISCPPGSPAFINAVVGLPIRPEETTESLLSATQSLEIEFGRRPKLVANEPRPLDLDIICFGHEIRHGPALILPHPRAHLRRFVLQPLSELAPDLILPGQSLTVSELLASLPVAETVQRL